MAYLPEIQGKEITSAEDNDDVSSGFPSEKYLIFKLADQEYALGVSMVKEVIHYTDITEIPNTSSYVRGVLSLRGIVIPVLDFMEYIGLSATSVTGNTCILIVHYDDLFIGILVDSVDEVTTISLDRFVPVPDFIGKENLKYFKAAIKFRNKLILLIDPRMEHV
ncbi:MAG TPA: chemotaxis protein CheW [Nitrospirota bacterium]|nr:chemotaxis protein CheW [Nitrospirota bacterium]